MNTKKLYKKKEAIKWKEMDPSHVAIMWLMIENKKDPISKYSLFSLHVEMQMKLHTEKKKQIKQYTTLRGFHKQDKK